MSQSNDHLNPATLRPHGADPVYGRIVLGTNESGQTHASGVGVGISLEDVKEGQALIAAAISDTPLGGDLSERLKPPLNSRDCALKLLGMEDTGQTYKELADLVMAKAKAENYGRLPDHLIGEADLSDRARFHEVRRRRVDELEEKFRALYSDIESLDKYDGVDQSAAWLARNSIIGGLHILRSALSGSVLERPVVQPSNSALTELPTVLVRPFNSDGTLSEYGRNNATISEAKLADGVVTNARIADGQIDSRSKAERDIDDCK